VISADEKTQPQALAQKHPTVAPAPGRPMLVEHEYERHGTLAYLAALDIGRRGKASRKPRLFGRCEETIGIEPFGRLVEQVVTHEPYASARRVFWIVDNGSSRAGKASIERLEGEWENLRLIHLPYHASWLNQIEIYFSILQRKALTPKDFDSFEALAERIMAFQHHWRQVAEPFDWRTRRHLDALMARLAARDTSLRPVA
jgi:DDE superfamily endonuclease